MSFFRMLTLRWQEKEGRKVLDEFLAKKLKDYNSKRNTPVEDGQVSRACVLQP